MKKKVIILLIVIFAMVSLSNIVWALEPLDVEIQEEIVNDDLQERGRKVLGIIQVIGNFVALGVLIMLGIKFVTGSAQERATYKNTMLPYLVGAVLIFAACNVSQIIYKVTTTGFDYVQTTTWTETLWGRRRCDHCQGVYSKRQAAAGNKCPGCGFVFTKPSE